MNVIDLEDTVTFNLPDSGIGENTRALPFYDLPAQVRRPAASGLTETERAFALVPGSSGEFPIVPGARHSEPIAQTYTAPRPAEPSLLDRFRHRGRHRGAARTWFGFKRGGAL